MLSVWLITCLMVSFQDKISADHHHPHPPPPPPPPPPRLWCTGAGAYVALPGIIAWCNLNCNYVPPFCPPTHCACTIFHWTHRHDELLGHFFAADKHDDHVASDTNAEGNRNVAQNIPVANDVEKPADDDVKSTDERLAAFLQKLPAAATVSPPRSDYSPFVDENANHIYSEEIRNPPHQVDYTDLNMDIDIEEDDGGVKDIYNLDMPPPPPEVNELPNELPKVEEEDLSRRKTHEEEEDLSRRPTHEEEDLSRRPTHEEEDLSRRTAHEDEEKPQEKSEEISPERKKDEETIKDREDDNNYESKEDKGESREERVKHAKIQPRISKNS